MDENTNLKPNNENEDNEKNKKRIKLILLFIIIFLVVFLGVYLAVQLHSKYIEEPAPTLSTSQANSNSPSQSLVENPIDFETLKAGNIEIYAWIKIDDTKVDYPIVQSANDDEFYLRHKAEDKSWSVSGAVYTEMVNNKTFKDAITLVYAHNGYGDSFFTTLHKFENEEFFNSHPYFTIYTTDRRLTYQIISAFKYDDRHIMNSFNFADIAVLSDFQKTIQNPDSVLKNVRTDLDTIINEESKIVILSTCYTNQKSSRLLVCGVLTKDEKTN